MLKTNQKSTRTLITVSLIVVGSFLLLLTFSYIKPNGSSVIGSLTSRVFKNLPATLTISPNPAPAYSEVMASGQGFTVGVPVASIIVYPDGSTWYNYLNWQGYMRFTFPTKMAGVTRVDCYQAVNNKQKLMSSMTFEVK